MRSVKLLAAIAAVSFSTLAFAADLPIAAPPVYAPPADFGGWYLRGEIGNTNLASGSLAYFADNGKWNFAWAHAGFARRLTPSVTLELAYSYIDLGSARR
jgi:opacity protein-like surface antigen